MANTTTALPTVAQYMTDRSITVRITRGERRDITRDGWGHNAYRLQLVRKDGDETVKSPTFAWRQGFAIETSPDTNGDIVLDSLVSDALSYKDHNGAGDFAEAFGYDDEREAARIYRECGKVHAWLVDFLGGTDELDTLAYDTERF